MSPARRLPWLRFLVVMLLVALDLWTKQWVFAWFGEGPDGLTACECHTHPRYPVLGDWLGLRTTTNTGAAWGALKGFPRLLVFGRVIAVVLLAVFLARTDGSRRVFLAALVLVLAGALGNLYDNLVLAPEPGQPFGAVRDFIDLYFRGFDYHFPTFNVADSCISVGAVLLLLSMGRGESGEEEAPGAGADAGDGEAAG